MGFTIEQKEASSRLAYEFQIHAELAEIRLIACSATAEESLQEGRPLRLGFDLTTDPLKAEPGQARFAARVTVYGEGENGASERAFEVMSRYALTYRLRDGFTPTPEMLEAFQVGNAVFQCWPYFREFFQNLTQRMGLGLPPLPMLRLAVAAGEEAATSSGEPAGGTRKRRKRG